MTKAINRNRTVEEILNNFRSAGTLPRRSLGSTLLGGSRVGGSSVLMSTSLEGGIASYTDSNNPQSQSLQAQRVEAIVAGVRAKALSGGLKALPPIAATRGSLGRSSNSTSASGNMGMGSDSSSSTMNPLGSGAAGGGGVSRGTDDKNSSNRPSTGQRRGNSRYANSSTIREGEEEGSDEEDGRRSDARLLPRK